MTTPTIQIGILGLRRTGTSIGLAIKRFAASNDARQSFTITGYDTENAHVDAAKTAKAIDHSAKTATECAAGQSIVVLTLPPGEMIGGLRAFHDGLRPGAVILDCSAFKSPALNWARSGLTADAHLIGITPLHNPAHLFDGIDDPAHARVDLFDGGHLLIAAPPNAAPDAIELAADFAGLLGATPHFVDADEHDAWQAWMTALPIALGVAGFDAMRAAHGWDGARRAGNADFGRLTHHLMDTHPDDLRALLTTDRPASTRALDAAILALQRVRDAVAAPDAAALDEVLHSAAESYEGWWIKRRKGQWDVQEDATTVARPGLLGGLIGRMGRRKS